MQNTDQTAEERLVTKSGCVIPFYGPGSLAVIDDEPYLIGMTIDMRELKDAQKQIELQLKEIKGLKDQSLNNPLIASQRFCRIIARV